MGEFSGKVVLVTGGSKGIGAASVEKFCEAGAHCVVVSRHLEEGQSFVADLKGRGWNAEAIAADVSKVTEIKKMVAAVVTSHARIDVLVNCAGVNRRKLAVEYVEEDWDYIVDINMKGLYFCCTEVGKVMIAQGGGAIVNVASLQAHVVQQERSIYAATKGGVSQLTKGLATEWADKGIRVNAVSPGYVVTPMTKAVLEGEALRNMIKSRTPLGRPATPDEIANLIVFLASPKASYMTATDVCIDGGWSET